MKNISGFRPSCDWQNCQSTAGERSGKLEVSGGGRGQIDELLKLGIVSYPWQDHYVRRRLLAFIFCQILASCPPVRALVQLPGATPPAPSPPAQPEVPKDSLGRTTPRGTVLGFMTAAHNGDYAVAAEYLNTAVRGKTATTLAEQLSVVLDRRLPARLIQLSDKPEGSLSDPLHPDRDLVGTIKSSNDNVNLFVERVNRGKSGPVWLFSKDTLKLVPDLYQEIEVIPVEELLPGFLVRNRVFGIPLFEWVAVLVGLPLLYLLTVLANRMLTSLLGQLRRRITKQPNLRNREIFPAPIRFLLVAIIVRWLLSVVSLSLLARLFWSGVAMVIAVVAVVWIMILLNGFAEEYARRYLQRRNLAGAASLLRLTRRLIDLLLIFGGALVLLYYFGISPTAGLAGLGVGGIAVALGAQKTLENVIAGASMVFDKVVCVGDFLKVGETFGTVDEIGLRSTRVRTLDRTVLSVPNALIANMSLETLSVRDKFWFHPAITLRYETTIKQLQSVIDNVRTRLLAHASVEQGSVRVRFLGFGPSSLNVDVFAYVYALDWPRFLAIQEELLFSIMEIIEEAGAQIALPSQTLYLAPPPRSNLVDAFGQDRRVTRQEPATKSS